MSQQTAASSTRSQKPKLSYIDNIKIFMTVLVILHHTAITYGGPGSWYYNEKTMQPFALIAMTMFVSLNQSFFMGFFFLLSAYFTPGSYEKKGPLKFLKDRMIRLGVPLVFYSFVFSPFLSFLVYRFAGNQHITYLQYLGGFNSWIDFGVLWFVAALLLFTLAYVVFQYFFGRAGGRLILPLPVTKSILLAGLILGVLSFLVRIVFPVGWVLKPLGFQLGHFVQYIAFFVIGIAAFQNQWFEMLSVETGSRMKIAVLILLFVFPLLYVIKTLTGAPVTWFSGGFHWEALTYALWEQTIGLAILATLLIVARERWETASGLLSGMARCSFAVYILHPVVIIALSLLFRTFSVDPALKFLLVAPLAVLGSFCLGYITLLIPGVNRII